MSSPPYSATSPPYPSPLALPRKRPSINTGVLPNPSKRRKPSSAASSSAHPLRQTSFPPPEQNETSRASSFSPTVGTSATGRSSTAGRKKRGKGKAATDNRSTTGGSAVGTKEDSARESAVNGGADGGRDDEDPEEDEADGAVDTVLEEVGTADEAQLKVERQNLRMLIEAFTNDQADRYDMWRRVRLKKETVRKITNQTLSQSVPASIVTTINGYTKLFAGELIERARDVQDEWLAASPNLPTGESKDHLNSTLQSNGTLSSDTKDPSDSSPDTQIKTETQTTSQNSTDGKSSVSGRFTVEERDRGPLTPDHLREALRRYKKDREGGSAGFQGLSLQGRQNVASRAGGKRLFR